MGLYDDALENERIGVWGTVARPQKWIKPEDPVRRVMEFPLGTPHDVIRAADLLERSGYVVSRDPGNVEYDPGTDSLGSYHDALAEIRGRHRVVVREWVPKLRCARGMLKMSIPQFAAHLGVSASYLRKCEAGTEIPAPDLFDRWRTLLGL